MKKKRGRRKRGRGKRRRGRVLAALLVVVGVVAAGFWIHARVAIRDRFESELWSLPSRIYSDAWVLTRGDEVKLDALVARLARCGYATTTADPDRPGMYRAGASGRGSLDVFLRALDTPERTADARRRKIVIRNNRVHSIVDARGRVYRQVVFEPELMASLFRGRHEERVPIPLDEVPQGFVRAVLAAEDARFFDHHGLDPRGILRAAWANVRQRRIVQGGSTITQQTVKNLYLDQRRTWWRKIRESMMAIVLEASYDKERILEVYLNEVYLGQRKAVAICGVQAAARFYFGRDLQHLSLGEWATLAGLIRSPGAYNPFSHPERAAERRDQVLAALARLGWATPEQVAQASSSEWKLGSGAGGFGGAPFAIDFVRNRLNELDLPNKLGLPGLDGGGFRVYTTIDTALQRHAEGALQRGLERLERDVPAVRRQKAERRLEGAIVITRPATGAVRALVGGRDYGRSQFNRAVQARRQPGSCFKPFVYAAGFERARRGEPEGLTASTLLVDEPLTMVSGGKRWTPDNYDRQHRGWVSAREALEKSLNLPTVRAGQHIGMDHVVRLARASGITSPLSPHPSLALGTEEVAPIELATAFGVFAAGGLKNDAWILRHVTNERGQVLYSREGQAKRALSPESAYLVNDLLQGVMQTGTARTASAWGWRGRAAGKTGTTDDTRDAWFVGYTPQLLGLVWVGYDDNAKAGLTGASGALPIWVDMMSPSLPNRWSQFQRPEGVVTRWVDPSTGRLAVRGCPEAREELYVSGSEPLQSCQRHRRGFRRWWRNRHNAQDRDAQDMLRFN